jgi:hypothetical protein
MADAKNWRPNFLVLAGNPLKRWYLIDLANAFSHDRGILSVATILPESASSTERKNHLAASIRERLADRGVQGLVRVVSAPTPYRGAALLVEAYGLGAFVPNTVLLGDGETTEDDLEYASMIASFYRANRNVVVVRAPTPAFESRARIDLWWQGMRGNGSLIVTLGHLVSTSLTWRQATLNIRIIVRDAAGASGAAANLNELVSSTRIEATVDVIVDRRPPIEVIAERSAGADLTFIGLPVPDDDVEEFGRHLRQLMTDTATLPAIAFVLAAEQIAFERILE